MMSANITAASTSWRRTGWSVTSAQSSGVLRDLEEGVALADRAVLGQRAARLAHEPHGRALDRLAARGADEERCRHARSVAAGGRRLERRGAARTALAGRRRSRRMRAGARTTARLVLENAGAATWRSRGEDGLQLSYHWLDRPATRSSGTACARRSRSRSRRATTLELDVPVDAPRPPGRYVLAFDLVEEHRFWLSEVGVPTLDVEVDVLPLIDERRLGGRRPRRPGRGHRRGARRAGGAARRRRARPPPPTSSRARGPRPTGPGSLLDAHAEGWEAVGPAVRPDGGVLARRLGGHALRPGRPGAATPASTRRSCCRRSSTGSRRRAPRAPRLRGGGRALRGSRRRHASEAIRSSTALKTTAPSTSATTAATQT